MVKDKFMHNKRFLARYRKQKRLIDKLEDRLLEKEKSFRSLKSAQLALAPSHDGPAKTIDDKYSEIEELEGRINVKLTDARKVRVQICEVIEELDNEKEVEVLLKYFIDDMSLEQISKSVAYSYRYVMRLYQQGVENVAIK